jgi:hypothetical protein
VISTTKLHSFTSQNILLLKLLLISPCLPVCPHVKILKPLEEPNRNFKFECLTKLVHNSNSGWNRIKVTHIRPTWRYAIAQAVSRRLPTAAARVRDQVRSSGICGGQIGTVTGFLRLLRVPLPILIPPTASHSSSTIKVWYNRPVSGWRTKWTQSHPTPTAPPPQTNLEYMSFCAHLERNSLCYLSKRKKFGTNTIEKKTHFMPLHIFRNLTVFKIIKRTIANTPDLLSMLCIRFQPHYYLDIKYCNSRKTDRICKQKFPQKLTFWSIRISSWFSHLAEKCLRQTSSHIPLFSSFLRLARKAGVILDRHELHTFNQPSVTKSYVSWDIMSCSPLKINRRFGGISRLHLPGRIISHARNQHKASS